MATFIAYQPGANQPSFRNRVFGRSSTIGFSSQLSGGPNSKSPQQARPVNNPDFVTFVDLTTSDQDAAREYLVAREILEPMAHDHDKRGIRITGTGSNGVTDSDKIQHGEGCDKDGDEIDYESETSDLPSLTDILSRSSSGLEGSAELDSKASASPVPVDRTGKEWWCEGEGDCGDGVNPTAAGIHHGASRDNPIVLDDDQPADTPDAAASVDKTPAPEVVDRALPGSPSPTLSGRTAEPGAENRRDDLDSLAKDNTDNRAYDEKEGGSNKPHKGDALHIRTLTRGNNNGGSGSSIVSDAPVSVGQIHDVFTEFKETVGKARQKLRTVVATMRSCLDHDTTARSIPPLVCRGESRFTMGNGASDTERLAEAICDDIGRKYSSSGGIENGSTFQSRQESEGPETQTDDVRSRCDSTLAGDYHSERASALTGPSPSPPPMAIHEAISPCPGTGTQGAPNRKRTRSSAQPHVLSSDSAPRKRPRRATKETWKVREAREAREASEAQEKFETKPSQTSLNAYREKRTHSVGLGSGRGEVIGTVADIEDVYFGEDGSIQCLVTWKPSLIAMENRVGEKLRWRCEELFGKRYSHQVQRKVVIKRQTRKK